ncbi:hypothetical protein BC832DRAFT_90855 [Gaertneriomyces semiglobifer]|nr:hypothetical protein BC832DRAFT_90855 [Gaertneriomyces semiglobifer]
MSGRGGGGGGWRGGRGGGRGGGPGGGSGRGGPEFSEDVEVTYKETPLFPDYHPQPFTDPTLDEHQLAQDWQSYLESVRDLAYFLDVPAPKPDVERWSDRFNIAAVRRQKPMSSVPTDLKFFPVELHSVKDPAKTKAAPRVASGTIDLDRITAKAGATDGKGDEEHDDDEQIADEEYDEEQEEDENDYLVDHYDDDMDAYGGEDGDEGRDDWS